MASNDTVEIGAEQALSPDEQAQRRLDAADEQLERLRRGRQELAAATAAQPTDTSRTNAVTLAFTGLMTVGPWLAVLFAHVT